MTDLLTEPNAFHAFAPKWEPIFWNLADYTPEQLLQSGAPWLEMLSVLRVERAEAAVFRNVFAEATKRLTALQGHEAARGFDCLRAVCTYASWRRPLAEGKILQDIVLAAIPTRQEEVRQMFQTIADELIERGRLEGRVEGRAEGRAEGELQTYRDNLRRLLLRKFKQLPDVVLQRIDSCTDVERLKTAMDRLLDWKSVEEIDI